MLVQLRGVNHCQRLQYQLVEAAPGQHLVIDEQQTREVALGRRPDLLNRVEFARMRWLSEALEVQAELQLRLSRCVGAGAVKQQCRLLIVVLELQSDAV